MNNQEPIRDARTLGMPKMLILGLQLPPNLAVLCTSEGAVVQYCPFVTVLDHCAYIFEITLVFI